MQKKPTQLKAPDLGHSRTKRRNDSPLFKSPQSSVFAHVKHNYSTKERLAPKEIVTPNLELLKQTRAKQSQENHIIDSEKKRLIKFTTQSLKDFDDECEMLNDAKHVCQNHPNKLAKYFLEKDRSIGLCTKCALEVNETQSILDEQKLHKTNEIDNFREMAMQLQNELQKRSQQNKLAKEDWEKECRIEVEIVNLQFQGLMKQLRDKKQLLVVQLQRKYGTLITNVEEQSRRLVLAEQAMQRYLEDIDSNYSDIVHSLSRTHFDEIMQQYHMRIRDYLEKIGEPQSINFDQVRVDLSSFANMVDGISLKRRGRSTCKDIDTEKENYNSLNLKNGRAKPKTPIRKII